MNNLKNIIILLTLSILVTCNIPLSDKPEYNNFIEYKIKKGKQNFKPNENFWPIKLPNNVTLSMAFDSSAYWSFNDWEQDKDYFDINKGVGYTHAFSKNNSQSFFIGWRPKKDCDQTFETFIYVNDNKTKWYISESLDVATNEVVVADLTLGTNTLEYCLKNNITELTGELPWEPITLAREAGTWIGGANNSEGPYGGKSTQNMIMYGKRFY